jgi:hypothetical protein
MVRSNNSIKHSKEGDKQQLVCQLQKTGQQYKGRGLQQKGNSSVG